MVEKDIRAHKKYGTVMGIGITGKYIFITIKGTGITTKYS